MQPQGLVCGGEPLEFQLELGLLVPQGLLAVVWACVSMTGGVIEQPAPQAALDVPDVPEQNCALRFSCL